MSKPLTEKACCHCRETKPVGLFWRDSSKPDGYAYRCKICMNALKREYCKRKPEKVLERRAKRKASNAAAGAEYRKTYPGRMAANEEFKRAMRRGILAKHPCLVCGESKVEGHHADYSRPLDVVWLCRLHHRQAHALARELDKKNASQ